MIAVLDAHGLVGGGNGEAVWTRPADWLALPAVLPSEQKFVGLHAVFPESNFCSLSAAGAFTVDWGDGVVENFAADATASHLYDYAATALNGTECSRGYKQAIVTVTPQAGQTLTTLNLHKKHGQAGLQSYASGFLDIAVSGPSLTTLLVGSYSNTSGAALVRFALLEQAQLHSFGGTNLGRLFYGCSALQSLPALDTTGATDLTQMFYQCYALRRVPVFDTSAATTLSLLFNNCQSLVELPLLDTHLCTNFSSFASGCSSLRHFPAFDMSAATNLSYLCNNCFSLESFPLVVTSNVTNMTGAFSSCQALEAIPALDLGNVTDFTNAFNNCNQLARCAATGIKESISFANSKLGPAALDEIYTNLATVTGKTITVTNAYGNTGDTPSIATAKGWTVTG